MKIEVLKEFIKKTVQQEVRNVIQSEIKLQLAEIFSKEAVQTKKKSADSDLEQQILKELETMEESSVIEEEVKPAKKFVKYTNNPMLNDILNQTKDGQVQNFIEMVYQIVILMDSSQRPWPLHVCCVCQRFFGSSHRRAAQRWSPGRWR